MLPQARIASRKVTSAVYALDIAGDITSFAEGALMAAYTQAAEAGARTFILNFAGLDYMNSSGIGLLVTLLIRANRQQHRLLAVELKDHYCHIFELTRLNEAIRVFADEAAALAEINTL